MPTITRLPQEIIARIAAGEVIERPAYAVKELVDNSLDAGADAITIHLEHSGLKKIIVHDNGSGMTKEDLHESFKLHTTSKIFSIDQLHAIRSLGFRGEALASITAMANMTLQSRTFDEQIGTEIVLENGKIIADRSIGMPIGTTVIVDNLFHTAPGRKKFLKSSRTEFRHCLDVIIHAAISHPDVSFTVFHNKRKLFFLPKNDNKFERLHLIFSQSVLHQLLPISYDEQHISIKGFISAPGVSLTTSAKQFLYVNHRHVTDIAMQQAIKQVYGNLLPSHRYPLFALFITLPVEFVDVNVHPRKEQVSISNKDTLIASLQQTITKTLQQFVPQETISGLFHLDKTTESFAGLLLQENVTPWTVRDGDIHIEPMQINKTFILLPRKNGFLLIDQHAAHERILFEQFSEAFSAEQKKKEKHNLSQSIALDLPFNEMQLLLEKKTFLERIGFMFEQQDDKLFLASVPLLFQDRNYIDLLLELVSLAEKEFTPTDSQTQKTLAYLACRQAIMAGDTLQTAEMKRLIAQLEKTNNNATCPHGRPTRIYVSLEELYTVFKRK